MTGDCANNNCLGSSLEARSDGRYTAIVTVGINELLISSSSKALLSAAKDVLEDFLSQQHTKECQKRVALTFPEVLPLFRIHHLALINRAKKYQKLVCSRWANT
jgi:hypothetical protein